ncbi:hypothetical protein [Piscicoccus intestinalis]|uniref:hypothetical protein n=1 Tax=Piscicoccus intestinalis TaxID=746033 RepID=UPI0012ED0897|nr:hypothetical protein [Piscicoccus intestinalis]
MSMTPDRLADKPFTRLLEVPPGVGTRRGLALAAVVVAGALLIAACGTEASTSSAPTTAATSATSSPASPTSPSSPSSPTTPSNPGGSTSGTGGQETASEALPTNGGEYGHTLLAAVRGGYDDRVATMATPAVVRQLRGLDLPNGLMLTTCEDHLCSWSNESGDRVTMTFDAAKLSAGAQQAVTAVKVATA